jgi:hypothetical protein
MMENLRNRGCELKGLAVHPDLESEEKRFLDLGWSAAHALDMNAVYSKFLPKADINRYNLQLYFF